MIEAVVGVALRAILASVVLGGVLVLCVLAATRTLALTASTRHALWTTALLAIGVMPLAGIGVSLARAELAHDGAARALTAPRGDNIHATSTLTANTPGTNDGRSTPATVTNPVRERGSTASTASVTSPVVGTSSAAERIAFARDALASWTPRVSHTLALGAVAVWGVGALIGLIGLGAGIARVRGLKRRSSPLDGTLADELPWLTEIGPGREIYLRLSYETETPVAIGFRRPVILIPCDLADAGGLAAIESLILHEYAHLRRHDDWTNLVQRVIERLFWFNPIVWVVGRRIALEREIASDDAVVEKTGAAHEYATSLWKLAREMRMPEHAVVAPGALLTRKQISVRIEQLLDTRRARLHRSPAAAFGVSLAALLAVGVVATSAPAVELPTAPAPLAVYAAAPVAVPAPIFVPAPAHPERRPSGTRRIITFRMPTIANLPVLPNGELGDLAQLHPQISVEIRRALREAMATLPAHIARAHSSLRRREAHYDGVKVSREMVAACTGCSMRNADVRGVDLHGLRIDADDFTGADMRNVNLAGARLTGVSLARANLSGADLRGASLTAVDLDGTVLENAVLDDVKLTGVSLQHLRLRGTSLRGMLSNCTGCDFTGMDLRGQDLHGILLNGADLSRADLRDANLRGAHFQGVDLSSVKLDGADLSSARFDGCDLSGVSLRGAKTAGMSMYGSGLDG